MTKAHSPINWKNEPNTDTPLNASNLNKMDSTIGVIDDRVVAFDATKANQTDMLTAITNVSFNESTGLFTFTRKNGTTITVDTKLEKLILNWNYDKNKQILYLILSDGSQEKIDLSSLISQYEFVDSTTIRWIIGTDGKVATEIIKGTITDEMLEPTYLAKLKVYAEQASASATNAQVHEENARLNANEAKTQATNASGSVEIAKGYAESANSALEEINKKMELATFELDDDGNLVYTDTSSYNFSVDNDGMLNYSVA